MLDMFTIKQIEIDCYKNDENERKSKKKMFGKCINWFFSFALL